MDVVVRDELWGVRSSACELLALSLRYPNDELAAIVASGEWASAAIEIWGVLGCELPAGWPGDLGAADVHDIRADATRLFVGAPRAACSPYEGFWRASDDGVRPLMFVNPHSMAVERFCLACGLAAASGGANEPLDHLATEFELLQYLASLAAGIAEPLPSTPASDDMPGGSFAAAYEQFMVDHVRTFAPRFAACLQEEAHTAYYRAVGALVGAFVESAA